MAPKKKESLLDACARVTAMGDTVAARMVEYMTLKHQLQGFRPLATEFLDLSHILFSIEAGLTEAAHSHNQFPEDMTQELVKRFHQTHDDFTALNQMLTKFLENEKKTGLGKLRKGWHAVFTDADIDKVRDSLAMSRETLRVSALVFRWSLGDAKSNPSMGIGYTGLTAVLERLNAKKAPVALPVAPCPTEMGIGYAGLAAVVERISARKASSTRAPAAAPRPPSEPPSEPPAEPPAEPSAELPTRLYAPPVPNTLPPLPPDKGPHYTLFPRPDAPLSAYGALDRHHFKRAPSTISSKLTTSSATRETGLPIHEHSSASEILLSDHGSVKSADSMTQIEDMIHEIELNDRLSTKAVRIKAEPTTVPRWTPKQTTGANSAPLRAALLSAVQQRKHKMIEQLLDCGVPPDSGLEVNVLREAVLNRDPETVRLLLLFGADPNAADRHGLTPLYTATELGSLEVTKLLLKYGGDPNLPAGPEYLSPLGMSVVEDRAEFVHLCLTYGGDANLNMPNGNTLLIQAISETTPQKLLELMLNYGSDPNGKNSEGQTPLIAAIQARRIDLTTVLLDHGANPNLPGPKHPLWSATYLPRALQLLLSRGADTKKCPGVLELATSINNVDSVITLLKAGVDPNAKNDGTYTPLCTAIRDNRAELVSLLLANGADPNVMASEYPAWKCVSRHRTQLLPELVAAGADLHKPKGILEKAVAHNNKEAVMYLLGQGVDPNARSVEGHTALTTAIRDDRHEFIDMLLARGADPGVRGQEWPISMAVKRPEILKKLLPHVANPRAVKGVIEQAVEANQLESVKLLLKAGVSVEDKTGGVFSPLTTAIREHYPEIVRFLLDEAGADVNAPGEHLPIIKAVRRCRGTNTDILEMLLARGADINLMYRGWNAVLQAVENGDANILRLLVERGGGVDLQVTDESGRTVMEIVNERGWDEAVTILTGQVSMK
ncbi:hypothetical protein A1O3_01334 [Capronia epimyces CBS 606.96]|uniref:Uncharacterized protein n=1 Tax=Capronia epimyces CBS 606.96 TaxID=1182542 RepID=W9YIR4_9EURO|nr:uncharacterized protein A1O3_01334 [Capronia epimyces CBS 606.96]EXJ92782.1 hypothetical protein A1O3_01334 [Capronia epimyces CBS 606.96]